MDLETAYLERILLHLRSNDPDDSVLTTDMNSWHAHRRGGPFLNRSGKPHWLSSKSSKRNLAPYLHAISLAAQQALVEARIDDLVIDHTIPSAELIRGLRARQSTRPFADAAELRRYLDPRFTLALITHAEHNGHLGPYRSAMIPGWCNDAFESDRSSRYCRYDAAGIDYLVQVHND